MEKREYFVFRKEFWGAIRNFPDNVRLDIINAICEYIFEGKERELLGTAKGAWCLIKEKIDKNSKLAANGKKGGRPIKTETNNSPRKIIEGIELVNITEEQYKKLVAKNGEKLTNLMISILEDWFVLKSPNALKYIGKNNYGHFREGYWVIQEARKKIEAEVKKSAPNWSV